jgi:hypothetical protein
VQLEAESRLTPRWWDDVDRLFAALPLALSRQLKLLEYELALRYSRTGQLHDVFLDPGHPPALSVATWLLHDLEIPSGATRDELERRLFVASVLLVARVQTVEGLRDPGGFTTDDRIAVVQWLSDRAATEVARVVPRDSSYWDAYDVIASEDATRLAALSEPDPGRDTGNDPEALLASPFSAPLRLVGIATLAAADRLDVGDGVAEMLDKMADACQVMADLASMHRDLELGRVSYPVAFIARAARVPIGPATRPEVILGAMIATGSLRPIVESALDRLRSARDIAIHLRLPTFAAFLSDAEVHFEGQLSSWTVGGRRDGSRLAPAVNPSIPPLPEALGMAEGFLLADPTFRESWETHREGMLGRPEVASRFPVGLILEILCRRGLHVRGAIDEFLDFTVANGFRYYDHPRSGVDSDTIGAFLRLRPHATASGAHDHAATDVLACLERNVQATGAIPVWLTGCAGVEESESTVIALGEGCGTVSAHLLLGMLAAGGEHRASINIGAQSLLDRIGSIGLAANVNYPPLFALGAWFRLLTLLDAPDPPASARSIEVARSVLTDALLRVVSTTPVTAQDAALLTLACHEANRQDLIDTAWLVRVLKRQRFDGSWIGEPFAAAPNRGRSVSWYSSTLLTTALCYDALARHGKGLAAGTD